MRHGGRERHLEASATFSAWRKQVLVVSVIGVVMLARIAPVVLRMCDHWVHCLMHKTKLGTPQSDSESRGDPRCEADVQPKERQNKQELVTTR